MQLVSARPRKARRRSDRAPPTRMQRLRERSLSTPYSRRAEDLAADPSFRTNVASNAGSPVLAPSPLIGTFNAPRGAASPGPNTSRPQSSRTQQIAGPANNSRQRPSSSTSSRVNQTNSCMLCTTFQFNKYTDSWFSPAKPSDSRSAPREGPLKNETSADAREYDEAGARASTTAGGKREDMDGRAAEAFEAETSKGRNSKTSTPALSTFADNNQSRARPTRSTDPAPRRNTKKSVIQAPAIPSDEESLHEVDDEDEEGEPRYCYCNEVSFGEMVACDNDACPREWFHLSCVGLTKPPGKNGECRCYCLLGSVTAC